jgi:hypothetical protein
VDPEVFYTELTRSSLRIIPSKCKEWHPRATVVDILSLDDQIRGQIMGA